MKDLLLLLSSKLFCELEKKIYGIYNLLRKTKKKFQCTTQNVTVRFKSKHLSISEGSVRVLSEYCCTDSLENCGETFHSGRHKHKQHMRNTQTDCPLASSSKTLFLSGTVRVSPWTLPVVIVWSRCNVGSQTDQPVSSKVTEVRARGSARSAGHLGDAWFTHHPAAA